MRVGLNNWSWEFVRRLSAGRLEYVASIRRSCGLFRL
jgi:hypothetical protein